MSKGAVRVMNHVIEGKGPAKVIKIVGVVILGIITVAVLAIVFGVFVKWLWNALMPAVFGLPEIGYWQAVGLVVLTHIFFGSDHAPHRYERSGRTRKKKVAPAGETEKISFQKEMEQDYAEFWREEGRDAFKSWMRRDNGEGSDED